MLNKVVVFGGTGFLGKRICQEAIEKGFQVVSLSRSGKPPAPQSLRDERWINEVNWNSANVFSPDTYHKHLAGSPNVVHSLGILLEEESYKKSVRKPLNISLDLKNWLPSFGKNPLQNKDPNFTYERMNKQSALIVADALMKTLDPSKTAVEDRPSFTYISADRGFPLIPEGYITSKRGAEKELMKRDHLLRPILMRPGFMFDSNKRSKDARSYIHNALELLNCGNKVILGNNVQLFNEVIRPTISIQQVSRSIISRIRDQQFEGVVNLEDILKA
ncbi:hypothetical protein HG535_0G02290 [Zygotorulaspora mrakii]|uniref:NAD-dependent epimerase/dehydratase domain-containing protein n=1 Tax=Zygotorulaspora mrakii TaxID=42260 RepID=A0A7H9B6J3_ZYGMR|nr:uncharacterized protein HG535_0G02290 [Zygotorulaspora mrakii]QLG74345.1 hypothetical protein HG535_0G02290 [Zygotorulaspora mrakii]